MRTTEWNRNQAVVVIQRCFMNYKLQLKELDKMQTISVVIKLQAFGRGIIQRKADVCKLKAICMIQSNVRGMFVRTIIGLWLERSLRSSIIIQSQYRAYYCKKMFYKVRSGIISLQSFARLRIIMAQMIVRNDAARKIQMFCKLPLFLIDQEKESKSVIMIQSTFRMHKIRSQHKKIILSIIYMQNFVRRIVAQNEYEIKVNAALLLQKYGE